VIGGAVAYAGTTAGRQGGPYLRQLARSTPIQPSDEIKAMWVVRDAMTSPDDIDRFIDFATRTGFHILFIQVRGRGDAYYHSSLVPPADQLKYPIGDFDPLAYVLSRAHAAGISVHAWLNVYYVWSDGSSTPSDGHVVKSHPEWLVTDAAGVRMDEREVQAWQADGIEGYYLSPFSAEARAHNAEVVRELVDRYAVDGIHLDYLRFPGAVYGYGTEPRTRFALQWGVDPVDLRKNSLELSAVLGADAVGALDSVWVDWRTQGVDSMVMAIRSAMGDLPLSAAVVPDLQIAQSEKGQSWARWIHQRWMDFVVPMAYNYRPEELLEWVRVLQNTVGREQMLVGLALHDGRDQYLDRSINILRVDRVAGFSLFSYNVLAEKRFAGQFIEQVFQTVAESEEPNQDSEDQSEEEEP